jgi:Tol biopolymer transport system component
MRKFVVLVVLVAAVAAAVAASASATPSGSNGLISFTSFDPALQQDVVYTINPDGTGERSLLVGGESGHWSPDGTRIAVIPDNGMERIINPDTGSYTELPTFYPDLSNLFLPCGVWSPDGSRLACEGGGDDPSASGVYTIRSSDGGDVSRVTRGAADDCPGDYSPNGKQIVFLRVSADSGALALDIVRTDGSDLRQITPAGMDLNFDCGSWSPQGNEILFAAHPAAGDRNALFVVHTDGTGLHEIPIPGCGTPRVGCFSPVWSPDGTKIAFNRFDSLLFQADLYTVNADGGGLSQVTHTGFGAGLVDWGTHPLNQ